MVWNLCYNECVSTITVEEIRRDPLAFLRRMEAGEPLLVVSGDHPVAEMKPVTQNEMGLRPYGLAAGQFVVPKDFDEPVPAVILADSEGE